MLNFHAMFIMADLGNEHTVAGSNEKVLCVIRAHRDGSFDMTPGFSTPGQRIRFEDDHGACKERAVGGDGILNWQVPSNACGCVGRQLFTTATSAAHHPAADRQSHDVT